MDDEHVGLFEAMHGLEADLGNQDLVDDLKEKMRDHFYAEEEKFCDSLDLPWDYCKEHKKKHSDFSERFVRMYASVDLGGIKWAQDWLAQHIKNTDFGYKGTLKHVVPEPFTPLGGVLQGGLQQARRGTRHALCQHPHCFPTP